MKIGIYGDSFAHPNLDAKDVNFNWSFILKEKMNAELENYGVGNTSIFYSYNNFLNTYKNHDLIIFLVTDPTRYTKKIKLDYQGRSRYISNYAQIEEIRESTKKSNIKLPASDERSLSNLEGWFIMNDNDYITTVTGLMLDHIRRLHSNVIFYPCFSTASGHMVDASIPNEKTLGHILAYQLELLGVPMEKIEPNLGKAEKKDIICGHFTPEFNEFFAELLFNKINTGKWDFSNYSNITMKHPFNYYYHNAP